MSENDEKLGYYFDVFVPGVLTGLCLYMNDLRAFVLSGAVLGTTGKASQRRICMILLMIMLT